MGKNKSGTSNYYSERKNKGKESVKLKQLEVKGVDPSLVQVIMDEIQDK